MKIDSVHRCPYCGNTYQVVFGQNVFANLLADPACTVAEHAVIFVCPYGACRKVEMYVDAGTFPQSLKGKPETADRHKIRFDLPNTFFRQRLHPMYTGGKPEFKVDEISDEIYRDYDEACRLLHVSPSASATYARRCVQQMIRTKFKVKPGRLQNEINALTGLSTPIRQEIIEALENLRKMGKFKALPDDDVRVIVDVSSGEAKRIIEIIEILLFDWFIAPEEHNRRLAELRAISNGGPMEK